MVIVLPLATPLVLIVVLCDAAVPGLAVSVVPFTATVPVIEDGGESAGPAGFHSGDAPVRLVL